MTSIAPTTALMSSPKIIVPFSKKMKPVSRYVDANATPAWMDQLLQTSSHTSLTTHATDAPASRVSQMKHHLTLVVDLDHTLVHARDKAAWLADGITEEQLAHLNVRRITVPFRTHAAPHLRIATDALSTEAYTSVTTTQSRDVYVKVRPGVRHLLNSLRSAGFLLWVSTAGSRAYARKVLKVIDPFNEWFDISRVFTRENMMDDNFKQIQLVQLDTGQSTMNRILILDDRRDVWALNEAERNVLQVPPYIWVNPCQDESPETMHLIADTCVQIAQRMRQEPTVTIATLLFNLTTSALKNCVVYFDRASSTSSLAESDLSPDGWLAASRLGYTRAFMLTMDVTHIVSVQPSTSVCIYARRMTGINNRLHLVTPQWFIDSARHLKRLPESQYLHETKNDTLLVQETTSSLSLVATSPHACPSPCHSDSLALLADVADTTSNSRNPNNTLSPQPATITISCKRNSSVIDLLPSKESQCGPDQDVIKRVKLDHHSHR